MKALITGVTGFAGSHLADLLIDTFGWEVHGIRRPRSRVEFIRYDIHFHEGDITDFCSMLEIISKVKPDYLFHLAAQSFVPLSWEAPKATLDTNIIGTVNVLEGVRRFSPETTVHIAGSSEEYGMVNPDECPITEQQPLRPLSPYGVSKVAADLLAQQYYRSYGLKTIITRAFNHTGPRRGEQFVTSKIARQLALIKLGEVKPVLTLGNLEAVRDFTDVRDMVKAYMLATERCQAGQPYNIGTGVGHTVAEVVRLLKKVSGVDAEIKQSPQLMRPSDVPRLIADPQPFKWATGWEPQIPFEQTMWDLFDYWMETLR